MSGVVVVAPEAMVARARLDLLFDPGTFQPVRSAVFDGVVAGSGRVQGRHVCAWAQEGTYKGGSLGAAGGETIARTIARADRLGVPVVGFPHSGGARLQEGVASLTAYGAIFRAQSVARVPIVSVIGGPCAGGAAYSPALGDLTIMAGDKATMFLTGPRVIHEVTREEISALELGGPRVQSEAGVCQLVARGDAHAAELVRLALAHLPSCEDGPLPLAPPAAPVEGDPGAALPARVRQVYDIRAVLARVVDAGSVLELAPLWAANLLVGFARIEGSPVGVIANQPRVLGGCLDAAASEKGAWFVGLCDRFGLPLVVLADTPGYLPGVTQERAGVLRHGASLLRAFGRARVPRVTVTLRQAYGGAHIVMNSRDLGATLTLAWPAARIGVMGARAAEIILGKPELGALADRTALDVAADGFVDEVIEPRDTRARLVHEFAAAAGGVCR